jgi:lysophospholipase L1-like esterase
MIHALVSSLQNADLVPRCPLGPDGKNDFATLDPRVVDDFKARTVALISAVVGMGARVVVVPQVGFHKAALARGIYKWWTPYLDQSALSALMKDFNKELRGIAQRMNVPYVESVDQSVWSDDLFIDVSHLNGKGNERLAALLVPEVRKVAPLTGE